MAQQQLDHHLKQQIEEETQTFAAYTRDHFNQLNMFAKNLLQPDSFVIIPKKGQWAVAQIISVFTKHFRVKELVWVENAFLLQRKWTNIPRTDFLPLTEENFDQYFKGEVFASIEAAAKIQPRHASKET